MGKLGLKGGYIIGRSGDLTSILRACTLGGEESPLGQSCCQTLPVEALLPICSAEVLHTERREGEEGSHQDIGLECLPPLGGPGRFSLDNELP